MTDLIETNDVPDWNPDYVAVAKEFHTAYEQVAPNYGYETREASAVPWEDVPEQNKQVMIATVAALIGQGVIRYTDKDSYPMSAKNDRGPQESDSYSRNQALDLAVRAGTSLAWDHLHTLAVAKVFENWVLRGETPDTSKPLG